MPIESRAGRWRVLLEGEPSSGGGAPPGSGTDVGELDEQASRASARSRAESRVFTDVMTTPTRPIDVPSRWVVPTPNGGPFSPKWGMASAPRAGTKSLLGRPQGSPPKEGVPTAPAGPHTTSSPREAEGLRRRRAPTVV